ncbi:MAG: hypothetical protein R3190_08795, partial [Thermoanaerobaculia bacterium]|nr:hypothetical protein [Thermoanaerobaculia bacterium]
MLIRHSHLPGRRAVSGRHPGPAVVLTGLCALATAAAAPAQIPVAGETVDVTVVNVDVYVIDKDGNPVTDLTEEDFQIRDAGKVVDIGFFSSIDARAPRTETEASEVTDPSATVAAGDPARIVLFVDTSESISAITGRVTSELADAIADRQPEVMVVAYDGGRLDVRQPFTADAATWRPALDGLTGGSRALITDLERRELLAEIEPILTAFAAQDSSGAFSQNSNSWAQSQARTRLDELMDSVRFFAQQEYQRNLRAVSSLQGLARALA